MIGVLLLSLLLLLLDFLVFADHWVEKLDGLSIPASTAEYVRRGTGMSGFPRRSFDQIPPDDDW